MNDPLSFAELRAVNVERCEAHYHPLADWSLADWLMAVTGELGELANVVKHARRGENHGPVKTDGVLDVAALAEEAADVVIYLDLLCARAGVDLAAAVREKFNRVSHDRLFCSIVLDPLCANCGKPAACLGAYEGAEEPAFACDECCAHGNEDGHCEQLHEEG